MSLDPTDIEIASFDTVLKVGQWAQLQGAIDQPQSPLGAFFAFMGAAADTHPRVLSIWDEADYKAVLQTWVYVHPDETTARAPSPVVLAQAGLVGRVCRINAYKEKTLAKLNRDTSGSSYHRSAVNTKQTADRCDAKRR